PGGPWAASWKRRCSKPTCSSSTGAREASIVSESLRASSQQAIASYCFKRETGKGKRETWVRRPLTFPVSRFPFPDSAQLIPGEEGSLLTALAHQLFGLRREGLPVPA